MQIIFIISFVVCALQIALKEKQYNHAAAMLPAICFGSLFGLYLGMIGGFVFGLTFGGLFCLIRYGLTNVRFCWLIWSEAEWGSDYYWLVFGLGVIVEAGVLFGISLTF